MTSRLALLPSVLPPLSKERTLIWLILRSCIIGTSYEAVVGLFSWLEIPFFSCGYQSQLKLFLSEPQLQLGITQLISQLRYFGHDYPHKINFLLVATAYVWIHNIYGCEALWLRMERTQAKLPPWWLEVQLAIITSGLSTDQRLHMDPTTRALSDMDGNCQCLHHVEL